MEYQILENPCELLYKPITFHKYEIYPELISIYCSVDNQKVCFSLSRNTNRCQLIINDIMNEFEVNKNYKKPAWIGSHPLLGLWLVF